MKMIDLVLIFSAAMMLLGSILFPLNPAVRWLVFVGAVIFIPVFMIKCLDSL